MSFKYIIGHELIKEKIEKSIELGRFSHAHLIVGEDGIGKSILAKEIALKILGKDKNRDYVDIIQWKQKTDKQSIGVDEIRDIIIEVNKKPFECDKKVVIIYNSDSMTIEAQNAFLKTIEEPPKTVTIILLSENLENILETIKSRCQIHKLKRLNKDEVRQYIKREYPDLQDEKIGKVISFSEGIPGRCKMFLEDGDFKEIRDTTMDILIKLCQKEKTIVGEYQKFFYKHNSKWKKVLESMVSYVRDIIIYKEIGKDEIIINTDKIEQIKELSNIYSFNNLYKIIDIIDDTQEYLDRKVNLEMAFYLMLLNMQEV